MQQKEKEADELDNAVAPPSTKKKKTGPKPKFSDTARLIRKRLCNKKSYSGALPQRE